MVRSIKMRQDRIECLRVALTCIQVQEFGIRLAPLDWFRGSGWLSFALGPYLGGFSVGLRFPASSRVADDHQHPLLFGCKSRSHRLTDFSDMFVQAHDLNATVAFFSSCLFAHQKALLRGVVGWWYQPQAEDSPAVTALIGRTR